MPRSWQPIGDGDTAPPAGAYSSAIRAGDLVFVSGQVPKDPKSGAIAEGDVRAQTRQVIANLRAALRAADADLDDLVSVTAYLASIDDWSAFNETYRKLLSAPYPTRTTLGAGLHGFLVEISAIAYAPRSE